MIWVQATKGMGDVLQPQREYPARRFGRYAHMIPEAGQSLEKDPTTKLR